MRVLLTNHEMTENGGTQTWTQTVANELMSRGIDVDVFTLLKGAFAKTMNCDVYTEVPNEAYDLALVNHNTCLGMIASTPMPCPIIFTSHGPHHMLERPAMGATHYVAVSEEVRAMQLSAGFATRAIIRNPIDMTLFKRTPYDDVGDVLVMCKNIEASKVAEEACIKGGLSYSIVHYQANPVPYEEIPLMMSQHRAVVTSGRGIYEALACGCHPFLFDVRSGRMRGDGWVTDDNIAEVAQYNCSGRGSTNYWTEMGLAMSLQVVNEQKAPPIGWVYDNHSVSAVVDKYLALVGIEEQVAA